MGRFAKPKTRADCHAEQPKQKDFGDRPVTPDR
jgi:hypothetical protein